MPNGMYGGVRGEKKNLPYSIGVYDRKKKISTAKNGAMQAPIKSSS